MSSQDKSFQDMVAEHHEVHVLYKNLFSSKEGQAVLADMSKQFIGIGSSFDPDPYVNAYNCGLRDSVLHIKDMMARADVDPAERFKPQQEESNV